MTDPARQVIYRNFPAHAGMTRDRSSPPGDLSKLPRTRGGDAHLLPLHPAPAVLRVALQQHAHGILDPASIERDYWMFQVARMMQAGSSACIPVSPFVIRRMPASAARARSDAVIAARQAASHLKRTWRSALRRPHYAARGDAGRAASHGWGLAGIRRDARRSRRGRPRREEGAPRGLH